MPTSVARAPGFARVDTARVTHRPAGRRLDVVDGQHCRAVQLHHLVIRHLGEPPAGEKGTSVRGYDTAEPPVGEKGTAVNGYDTAEPPAAEKGTSVRGYDTAEPPAGEKSTSVKGYDTARILSSGSLESRLT